MIFVLLVVYQLKHLICDYFLQGKYMLGKFQPYPKFILPLLAHASVHGMATFLIALCVKPKIAFWVALLDLVAHFVIDRVKASPNMLGRFKALDANNYVYVPVAHLKNYVNSLDIGSKYDKFIPRDRFTAKMIVDIANFRPEALFGGVITSYQKEEVPKFLKSLKEVFPELAEEACKLDPSLRSRFESVASNVGRKAYLSTLEPNVGTFKDIHSGEWKWDGEYILSTNSHMSFGLCSFSEVRLKPLARQVVVISDDAQVTDKTEFLV